LEASCYEGLLWTYPDKRISDYTQYTCHRGYLLTHISSPSGLKQRQTFDTEQKDVEAC